MNIKYKVTTAIATGTMLAALVVPSAFAANNATIIGNGKNSTNKVKIKKQNTTTVVQGNSTIVGNVIGVITNTGGNKANGNTGRGDISVNSGRVTNTVSVNVGGSTNSATLPDCGCEEEENDADIRRNGKNSKNKVKIVNKNETTVVQGNSTIVINGIVLGTNTGGNKANGNTGAGDKTVNSGPVENTVTVDVEGNTNTLD